MKTQLICLFLFLHLSFELHAQWSVKHLDETEFSWENKIKFKNDSLGLYMDNNSILLKSVDSGETWKKSKLENIFGIKDFQFVGDSTVFAVGNIHNGSLLLKSLDNGDTWDSIAPFSKGQINSFYFFNEDSAFACGVDGIFWTKNGGIDWKMGWNDSLIGNQYGALSKICFPTPKKGYAAGFGLPEFNARNSKENYLLKTSDSGQNWDTLFTTQHSIIRLYFLNADTGFYATDSGLLMKTTDGGHTWFKKIITTSQSTITSIHFITDSIGFATGSLYIWLTGGGNESESSSFFISKTTDGGNNWETFSSPGIPLNSIFFINDSTGFVSGGYSLIMKTKGKIDELPADYPWYLVDDGMLVQEVKDPDSFVKVYPNPTNGIINLESKIIDKPIERISLFKSSGKMINSKIPKTASETVQFDLSGLPSGIYLLQIKLPREILYRKIIKR